MDILRRIGLTWLVAVMVLTSGSMALARTAPDGTTIVICAGAELSTVIVDANGNEIEPMPVCPDCLSHTAMLANAAPRSHAPDSFTNPVRQTLRMSTRPDPRITADARGPPSRI